MEVRFDKFFGLGTRWGRNLRPPGFLDDVQNMVLNNKSGKLVSRTGYAADLNGDITDVSGAIVIHTFDRLFYTATETPESVNIKVIAGKTAGATPYFLQDRFYHGSSTGTASWLVWGESKTLTGITVGGQTIIATNAGQSDNYYKGWIIYNSTRSQASYVTGYTASSKTFALNPYPPSGWLAGDTYVAYRHYHDNPGYTPSWTDACCTKQGNNILASGGQGSNVGYKLGWSGYLNKIFFSGANSITHQETYVSENEVKSTNGVRGVAFAVGSTLSQTGTFTILGSGNLVHFSANITSDYVGGTFAGTGSVTGAFTRTITGYIGPNDFVIDTVLNTLDIGTATATAPATSGLEQGYYSFAYSLRTDDGNRGPLIRSGTVQISTAGTNSISSPLYIDFPFLNKRVRYIDWFAAKSSDPPPANPDWSGYFQFKTCDLLDTNWTYTGTSGATIGYFSYTGNIVFTAASWSSASAISGGSAPSLLGYTEPNTTTVACSRMSIVGDMLIVHKYYDFFSGLNYNDQFRRSPFSGDGVPQFSVLPDIDDLTQSTIASGDPNVITNISGREQFLFVAKTRGIYYVSLNGTSTDWTLTEITKQVGSDAPLAVVSTPYGIIFVKSGEDIYRWTGGQPESLMENFLTDFRAISGTYVSQWVGWYNPTNKSYMLMITTDGTTFTTVYEICFEVIVPTPSGRTAFAITKHVYNDGVASVAQKSDGTVFFSTGANKTFSFSSAVLDGATAIAPYFKINGIVPDERDNSALTGFSITNEQSGTPANTLDVKLYVDGSVVKTVTPITKTLTTWRTRISQSLGKKLGIEFNTNSPKATWDSLTIDEVVLTFEPRKVVGDLRSSL